LYWATPNARQRFRWFSPGSVLAVLGWLAASVLFGLYGGQLRALQPGLRQYRHHHRLPDLAVDLQLRGTPPGTEPFAELRDTRKLRQPQPIDRS
jgi:hypothetical protein